MLIRNDEVPRSKMHSSKTGDDENTGFLFTSRLQVNPMIVDNKNLVSASAMHNRFAPISIKPTASSKVIHYLRACLMLVYWTTIIVSFD
jgi:hypothetical protein